MTLAQTWLEALQALVTNRLDHAALEGADLAAIIGDTPSTYAKSPRLWNAAFRAMGWHAAYIPLDVPQGQLSHLLQALRGSEQFMGGSVTVPYKTEILPLLDEVDPMAARIGAVNVVTRARDGRLIGYNTDGLAGVQALAGDVIAGHRRPCERLAGARVLLIGSGGAARAVGVSLWDLLGDGELVIANRSRPSAEDLVQQLAQMRPGHLSAIGQEAMAARAPQMDVIINATVKGQAGIRRLADGQRTCLEPYSALAPAQPAGVADDEAKSDQAFHEIWLRRSQPDISRNQERSLELCARLPQRTVCYDLIYAPLETTFLRHARWSGYVTLNGKRMNIVQAVEAFVRYVCRERLREAGMEMSQAYQRVAQVMADVWT